jgi:plastocyanin
VAAPTIAGLAVGVALVAIFSVMDQGNTGFTTEKPSHVTVIIPESSSSDSEQSNFEPATIKVVIGVNNTIRWVNDDTVPYSVVADDNGDPDFYDITSDDAAGLPKSWLGSGETFEFTFTKPREYGYHSVPHPQMHGAVIVLAPEK